MYSNYTNCNLLIEITITLSVKVEVKKFLPHRFGNNNSKTKVPLDSFAIW